MNDLIKDVSADELVNDSRDLSQISYELLQDYQYDIQLKTSYKLPITELALLGSGVSSLIPAFRTVTQTSTINAQGLFRIVNMGAGDALKIAKNGDAWGAFKTAAGGSKMARMTEVGNIGTTSTTVMPIDPATIMMAVALYSIELQLKSIQETQKKILDILEIEKEAEVENDLKTLIKTINEYKYKWDKKEILMNEHKQTTEILKNSSKNILVYKKSLKKILESKNLLVSETMVSSTLKDLTKKFKYYKLSLFTYSLSSFIEIMLTKNFNEEYISLKVNEIEELSKEYRYLYTNCSHYLEKLSSASIERNLLKGVGNASNALGKFIEKVPVIKDGQVDEFLQDGGKKLEKNARNMKTKTINTFSSMKSPDTAVFIEKLNDVKTIYNNTSNIYFDNENIYLTA